MFAYILESGIFVWLTGIFVFVLLNLLTKKIQVSFLDSLGFLNANVAFSLTTLFSLYSLGLIGTNDVVEASLITASFYAGIFIVSTLNKKKIKKLIEHSQLYKTTMEDGLLSKNLIIIGSVSIVLTTIFSILLLSQGGISDDRIIIAKSLRGPDLIRQGASVLFCYISLLSFMVRRNKLSIVFLVISITVSFFSGSKGFLIPYAIAYFTLNKLLYPQKNETNKNIVIVCLILLSSSLVKVFWGSNPVAAFFEIINRLFSSGDTYYYAYHLVDKSKLFDDYSFFSYLLHPFSSLISIKGYNYPIGANLFGRITGDYSGYGPNAYLPIVLIILLKGNAFFAILISFLFGSFVCVSRIYGLKILGKFTTPPFWRISIFIVCFVLTPNIFVDIGMFQQSFIAIFVIVIFLSIFYEMSGYSYGIQKK